MAYLQFILKSALFDFSRNKGRTFLTSLGILIGVLAVVLLTAFGLGLKKYINDQFESLGTGIIRILPGQLLRNGNFSAAGMGSIRFDNRDLNILFRAKTIQYALPVVMKPAEITSAKTAENGTLYASNENIFPALNLKPKAGEVFAKTHVEKRARVAVIGPKLADKLFTSPQEAVGKKIKVANQSFTVIGVLHPKGGGGFGGPDLDSFVYLPHTTAEIFNPDKKYYALIAKAKEGIPVEEVKEEITTLLGKRYKTDDFSVIDQAELLSAISSIFNVLNSVLIAIAAISLLVGGIGIMNIMYVTVTERIKEIGIRRSVGATRLDILSQFLLESVILSLFGGLAGLLLAYIGTLLVQSIFPAYIDTFAVILALGVSSAIGIIFGILPARKAASLSPIEAIRYE